MHDDTSVMLSDIPRLSMVQFVGLKQKKSKLIGLVGRNMLLVGNVKGMKLWFG
jgi:hypothetical protein